MRVARAISKDLEELERAQSQAGFMISQRRVGHPRQVAHALWKNPARGSIHGLGQGVGLRLTVDSSSLRMSTWPLEWKVPPVAVLASFMGVAGRK